MGNRVGSIPTGRTSEVLLNLMTVRGTFFVRKAEESDVGNPKQRLAQAVAWADENTAEAFASIREIRAINQRKVLAAFQAAQMTAADLAASTGYGYDDRGRDLLEKVFAKAMGGEAALVRHQFSSGTQVLYTCLRALLRPGDELLIATGLPYDSIRPCLGIGPAAEGQGGLDEFGISVKMVPLKDDETIDVPACLEAIGVKTALLYLQRSRGYERRASLTNAQMGELMLAVKAAAPALPIMVDNCYGEFVEAEEPTAYGADLIAGSLIKNPGGGMALTGGYVLGEKSLVDKVATAFTAPGLGAQVGPSLGQTRDMARGFYLAPLITAEALKAAVYAAALAEALGMAHHPSLRAARTDTIQCLELGTQAALQRFCTAIQAASVMDAIYAPVPAPMPGYDCDIMMASGSFVQGSSIELSCDGPLRPPYDAFFQGGLSFDHAKWALQKAFLAVLEEGACPS